MEQHDKQAVHDGARVPGVELKTQKGHDAATRVPEQYAACRFKQQSMIGVSCTALEV